MPNNVSTLRELSRHALDFIYSASKFQQRSSATLEVLIIVQKQLFNLILKSISKFLKVSKT